MLRLAVLMVAIGCCTAATAGNSAVPIAGRMPPDVVAARPSGGARGRGVCIVNGVAYPEGEFSVPGAPCVIYNCEYDGMYYFVQEACHFRGRCWAVNQQYQVNCQTYRCTSTDLPNNYRSYRSDAVGQLMCSVNGRCHPVGEVFEQNCHLYRCYGESEDPSGYSVEVIGRGGC